MSNSVTILTKPGQLREGFHYQDLYGMHLALAWLEQPTNFTWMRLEADDFGSLDDVAALKTDGTLTLNQIKHVTERPERPGLSLDDLLEKDSKKSRSLFQKWFKSWLLVEGDRTYTRVDVVIHANRPAAEDLAAVFSKDFPRRIDATLFRSSNPTTFATFVEQAGEKADRIDEFFAAVTFRLDSADIEPTEQVLRDRAANLNITPEGFTTLLDQIYAWSARKGSDRKTIQITLDLIKRACGWRQPERLSEEFPIAEDYVPLGVDAVQVFADRLLAHDKGAFLISDVPGAGKSTFLAKVYSHLDESSVPCVRHHYFLSGDDDSKYPRLNAKRTADAIIAELAAFIEVSVSASLDQLRNILTKAADELKSQERRLVLLLDGLDHVLREEDEHELSDVLKQLLPAPPNLLIVFGTREGLSTRVQNLLRDVPAGQRYSVPRMTAEDCKAMLLAHPAIEVPENALDAVCGRLAVITEGLPLHAHYCMIQLEGLSQKGYIFEHVLEQLVPYGGDLKRYYEVIWAAFSAETKILAIVLAFAEFSVPRQALPFLFSGTSTELQRGVDSLRPFVNETLHGLTLFHASFQEFVAEHPDTETYKASSLERLILWLKEHASVSLRWRWLHAKEWEAGNSKPLLEATHRDWVIDSIREGRSPYAVEELLRLACDAAMQESNYCVAMDRSMSAGQLDYGLDLDDTRWSDALSLAGLQRLDREPGVPTFKDYSEENSDVLVELASRVASDALLEIEEELFVRFERIAFAKRVNSYFTAVEGAATYYLAVLVISLKPIQEAVNFISRFRTEPARFGVSSEYLEALLRAKQYTNAKLAVEAVPVNEAQRFLLREKLAFSLIAKKGIQHSPITGVGPWAQLYRRLVLQNVEETVYEWPADDQLPASIQRYNEDSRHIVADAFHSAWLNGLVAGVVDDPASLNAWTIDIRSEGWTGNTASRLAAAGFEVGKCLRTGADLASAISEFDKIEQMRPGEVSWDDYELWIAYKRALVKIFRDAFALRYRWQDRPLDDVALAKLAAISGCEEHDRYKILLMCEPEMLLRSVVESFTAHRIRSLETRLDEFPERAESYLEVATLARRVGSSDLSETCLRHAVDNLLGYGNHKDIYLHELLQSLKLAVDHKPGDTGALLDRVAPIVNVIRSVTDGDETSHLVEDFTEISVQRVSSAIAGAVYLTMVDDERYYDADKVFSALAEFGDLSNIWVQSLLRTAIDTGSRHQLTKRAQQEPDAAALVSEMKSVDHDPALEIAGGLNTGVTSAKHERGLGILESDVRDTDPEKIRPEEFAAFCTEHRREHHLEDFAERWWDTWVSKDRRSTYDALTNVLEQRLIRSWSGDLELRLLPLRLEFEGAGRAFEALITAARSVYVWNSYYTQAEKTDAVFNFLFEHFPRRVDEFIRRTVETEGYRRRLGSLPVRRGSQFLFAAGRPDEAIKLISAGVDRVIALMANVSIPRVDWTSAESNLLEALFGRLFHVHPEVRFRAAQSLSDLLLRPETASKVREQFEKRLNACVLESELVTLLYPIAYARRRGYVWTNADLEPLLSVRSVVSDLILVGGS